MPENSVSFLCRTKYCKLNTKEIIKSFTVQRLKKLEEQCIHHFNLINYDCVNIVDH